MWVNPGLLLYVSPADGGGSSMYGETNARTCTKLHFANGVALEVKEAVADVVARFAGAP